MKNVQRISLTLQSKTIFEYRATIFNYNRHFPVYNRVLLEIHFESGKVRHF